MNQEDTIVDQLKVRFAFPFHIFLLDYNIEAVECEQSVGICSIGLLKHHRIKSFRL
jgi:hypothetical protein